MELQQLYEVIDHLSREEVEQLHSYIQQRRLTTVWAVPAEEIHAIENLMRPTHDLTAEMSEEEINSVIDEAIHEVRRERKARSRP